jgi:DNA-binding CsgD family transcriptional regulator
MRESQQYINPQGVNLGTAGGRETANYVDNGDAMELMALIHTKLEHTLYELMLTETRNAMKRTGAFSVSHLMISSGIHNHSKVRRARAGLLEKMSIERQKVAWGSEGQAVVYAVFGPEEILDRRQEAGLRPFAKELAKGRAEVLASGRLTEWLVETNKLSPREAQVALKCTEGLTNAEIGKKLFIQEETVKFHLRNIFIKFGLKRRTELMALLFEQERSGG